MRKYFCRESGCRALLDKPGYCEKHRRPQAARPSKPFEGAVRSNYYGSSRWKALARQAVRDAPYCEACGASRADGAILEAHHRTPPRGNEELFFDRGNLQTLCRACHRVVTAREALERKQRARKR